MDGDDTNMSPEALYQITSHYFCAGIIVNTLTGRIKRAAPIVRWSTGKDW